MLKKKKKQRSGIIGFFIEWWRQVVRFISTGLLVWIPLLITVWIAMLVFNRVVLGTEHMMKNLGVWLKHVSADYPALSFLQHIEYVPGTGFLLTILLFLATGFLTRFLVGRKLISYGEHILQRIPLISRVYKAVQQIRDVFVGQGAIFQKVVLIEYPRKDMWAVGFLTSTEQGLVQNIVGKELHSVFVPTTPNPTSGYLVYMNPEEILLVDITVEEAMKLIVSGGAYIPGKPLSPIGTVEEESTQDPDESSGTRPKG